MDFSANKNMGLAQIDILLDKEFTIGAISELKNTKRNQLIELMVQLGNNSPEKPPSRTKVKRI
jgi:hypothetical protein